MTFIKKCLNGYVSTLVFQGSEANFIKLNRSKRVLKNKILVLYFNYI